MLSTELTSRLHSVFKQESQKSLRNDHPIMLPPHSLQRIFGLLVRENPLLVSHFHEVSHNALIELGMALDRYESVLLIHALYEAARRRTKRCNARRVLKDDVSVHLVDCQRILLENLLALCGELHG